jgi:hypothetical protein
MRHLLALVAVLIAAPAAAQLGLPGVALPQLPDPTGTIDRTLDRPVETLRQSADRLLDLRAGRIERLLRRERETVEADANGEPARRGELLLLDPDPATLAAAQASGFAALGSERLEALGLTVVRLQAPRGLRLSEAEARLRGAVPRAENAHHNHNYQCGAVSRVAAAAAVFGAAPIATPVGMIDGAPGKSQTVAAQRGFARGAPRASDHGSAVASLLAGAGARRVLVADVYGTDPAGGNALAIARALDWLAQNRARVVTISLVGPRNAVLEKAVARARGAGIVVVAAVGNDGPAAPPAYPASYPGVVAVTAVDGRQRPLIEAGRALHLDYAAPGADILAANKGGKRVRLRGTSYAAPLVAARLAAALDRGVDWRGVLDREAEDLGQPGADESYGRGLLCRGCGR